MNERQEAQLAIIEKRNIDKLARRFMRKYIDGPVQGLSSQDCKELRQLCVKYDVKYCCVIEALEDYAMECR